MKYSAGKLKRIFTVRLEDGDIVHECLEELAKKEDIQAAAVIAVGGADKGSTLIVGPEKGRGQIPVRPQKMVLDEVHEIVGTGTIFRDENGKPLVHMHMACGRNGQTVTGCIREGVRTWHIIEAIVIEMDGKCGIRRLDETLGFKLLVPEGE